MAWAARVAACDGVVDPRERAGLLQLAERADVSAERLDEIVGDALAAGGEPPLPATREIAREWTAMAARIGG